MSMSKTKTVPTISKVIDSSNLDRSKNSSVQYYHVYCFFLIVSISTEGEIHNDITQPNIRIK